MKMKKAVINPRQQLSCIKKDRLNNLLLCCGVHCVATRAHKREDAVGEQLTGQVGHCRESSQATRGQAELPLSCKIHLPYRCIIKRGISGRVFFFKCSHFIYILTFPTPSLLGTTLAISYTKKKNPKQPEETKKPGSSRGFPAP